MDTAVGQEMEPDSDDKGRRAVVTMSDRQLLKEIVTTMRDVSDAMEVFQSSGMGSFLGRMMAGKS